MLKFDEPSVSALYYCTLSQGLSLIGCAPRVTYSHERIWLQKPQYTPKGPGRRGFVLVTVLKTRNMRRNEEEANAEQVIRHLYREASLPEGESPLRISTTSCMP
jgi:hypothetical protein